MCYTVLSVPFHDMCRDFRVSRCFPKVLRLQSMSHGLSLSHNHYTRYKDVVAIKQIVLLTILLSLILDT